VGIMVIFPYIQNFAAGLMQLEETSNYVTPKLIETEEDVK